MQTKLALSFLCANLTGVGKETGGEKEEKGSEGTTTAEMKHLRLMVPSCPEQNISSFHFSPAGKCRGSDCGSRKKAGLPGACNSKMPNSALKKGKILDIIYSIDR